MTRAFLGQAGGTGALQTPNGVKVKAPKPSSFGVWGGAGKEVLAS
jgi:hypothetical protein